ncbi:MAG: TonB-dependent receptor [Acidobacteria bacterium]|nr:TonB-dependent receptor [Acidobacteriota bacterium]
MRRLCTGVGVTPLRILLSLVAAFAILVCPGAVRVLAQAPPAVAVEGRVLDAETGAAIPDAVVLAVGEGVAGEARAVTDAEGRFSLVVPRGRVVVRVEAPAYFSLTTTLDVGVEGLVETELALAPDTSFATSVDVVASAPGAAPATEVVQPSQVLRTPGAADNIFRTLQTLPGVAATEEFGSRLAVRGGAPDQNLTVMDGVEVHDPYRLFGLTTAFNPETIQRFELSTGGFSVEYGDRLSSLLVVENRDGRRDDGLTGSASLSITDANVVLEGPLPGDVAGSWLVTGRRTYYDLVAERFTDQQFPGFADVQAKGVWEPSARSTVTVFGLRSRQAAALEIDQNSARGTFQDDTDNDLAWARIETLIGARGHAHTVVAYSDTRSTFGVDAVFENTSRRSNAPAEDTFGASDVVFERALTVEDLSVRQGFSWAFATHVVEAGAEVHRLSTGLRFEISGDRNPGAANGSSVQGGAGLPDLLSTFRRSTRGGVWLRDTWHVGSRGVLQAGLRVDRVGITRETQLSPRMAVSLDLGPATRVTGAVGRYTQSPGYEKLAQSDYVLDLSDEAVAKLRSEQSWHGSVGAERDLGLGASLRVEGYYKYFADLLLGQLESEIARRRRVAQYDFPVALTSSVPTDPIITTIPGNDGRGRAYGFDVLLSRLRVPSDARVNGWASYTWGKAVRDAYGRRYAFEYDRRHAFAMVGSYRLTPRWELASTIRVASGFPRTAPIGIRVAGTEDANDVDADGDTSELVPDVDGEGRLVYAVDFGSTANLNQARLPMFARVDVRATWRPRGAAGRWELYAEVINALNRKNAGAYEPRLEFDPDSDRPRLVEARDQSIPRLPTVGIRFRF